MQAIARYDEGYLTTFITDIEYGIEDTITAYDYHGNKWNRHKCVIKYDGYGEPYFKMHGQIIHLDECIRGAWEF